jgi:2-dehydropantoate 2-reductase
LHRWKGLMPMRIQSWCGLSKMNNPIETVAIVGAGALGAAYASIFYDKDKSCISFVAAGDRCERLRKLGVIVNGKQYSIPALSPDDLSAPSDLVIVAVKDQHLQAAIHYIRNRVGEQTTIISVMNGIESEEQIGAVYGMEKVLYAIVVGIDALRVGNNVNYVNLGKIFFGEAQNTILTERVKRVQVLFDKMGINYETPPDMIRNIWWKFMINVGINQASAVLRAPYSVFQTSPEAINLMQSAMHEVIMIAAERGIKLSAADIEQFNKILSSLNPLGKTSMLQDIEAGRKTEVEMFAGKVIELGRKFGVPTPVNEKLFAAIRKIEAGNDQLTKK